MTFRLMLVAASLAVGSPASAQQMPPAPAAPKISIGDEAAGLMQGWALMAQGQAGLAESHAATILQKFPRSVAAAVLAIEASIASSGAEAGLDQYDRWIGHRTFEDPSLLRRVGLGVLNAEVRRRDSPARAEALRHLAGEPEASGILLLDTGGSTGGSPAEMRLRASLGDEQAISNAIESLKGGASDKITVIEALAASRSPRAASALTAQLKDARPEVRGAAAEGLGRLQATAAQEPLKLLLSDSSSYVRIRAAAALLQLQDTSGLPLLRELLVSEIPASRLIGAEALAGTPDTGWLESVRALARTGEPTTRLAAARLLSPHDPALARSVADALATDPNPAVRELASRTLAETLGGDLTGLRRLLRSDDLLTRVKAAAGILTVTR